MITTITFYLTLDFTMSIGLITLTSGSTIRIQAMTFREAQRLTSLLNEDGYHAWAVDGFHVNVLFDGVLYELKTAEQQPNERS